MSERLYRFHDRGDEEWFRQKLVANGQLVPVGVPDGEVAIEGGEVGAISGDPADGVYLLVRMVGQKG